MIFISFELLMDKKTIRKRKNELFLFFAQLISNFKKEKKMPVHVLVLKAGLIGNT